MSRSATATAPPPIMCLPGRDYNGKQAMGLLSDTQNPGLRMRRECQERFPRHRLQRKPLVSDPGMHHGTCVTHVPWCMSGTLNRGGGGNRSRHSRRMRNAQFYVSGKRPMGEQHMHHTEGNYILWFALFRWSDRISNLRLTKLQTALVNS